ncbi:DUF4097 family beta strand repeat-containing protein [Dyella nitratireducens]|uniref:DUF4097 domain-containing protein n=1 Tax=Dyella nitratireducens TaxID=1849580 RepID=A0ABQ1G076_9GAMM|nr:DUF4097 family beta strand repeat-containing protein [Dyella nitratireducens]GGA34907.1 hypothetical protein GCM10010981_24940 [Dyella nitratireducens]GLQ40929.1 hypothetical protein GCM10007902_07790 [Dyella nitratireducens]
MRYLLALLALLPLAATAADCRYSAPRNLHDDLAGVRRVQIELHSYDLHLVGNHGAGGFQLNGRACASSQSALDNMQVTSHREGDQLIVDVGANHSFNVGIFGDSYAYLDLQAQLPSNVPVSINSGSGDVYVGGLDQLDAHTGSGDLHIDHIAGEVSVTSGSGDVELSDIGSLKVGSVGSGDVKANNVREGVNVGNVGSGDVTLEHVGGSVYVSTIGSGDLVVKDVHGDFTVGARGSGDVTHTDIAGKVSVPHDD